MAAAHVSNWDYRVLDGSPLSVTTAFPSRDGVVWYSALSAIEDLAPHWQVLEQACPERFGYFQSFDWCRAWARGFLSGPDALGEMRLLALWREGRIALLWPAMVSSAPMGVRVLSALGEPHTQYNSVLYDPALVNVGTAHQFRAELQSAAGFDLVNLASVPAGSWLDRTIADFSTAAPGSNETAFFDLASIDDLEQYNASLSGTLRRKRKERRRRMARAGNIGFQVFWPHQAEFARLISDCVVWKRRWLSETGRYSQGFSIEGYERFLSQLTGNCGSRSGAVLFVLDIDGAPAAAELGFIHRNDFYAYIGGFDWDYRQLSPGKVLMEMVIEWLHAAGVARYDLLGNPAEYKSTWSNTTVALTGYVLPVSLRGRIYAYGWLNHMRPGLKKVYDAIPPSVRRAVLSSRLVRRGGK